VVDFGVRQSAAHYKGCSQRSSSLRIADPWDVLATAMGMITKRSMYKNWKSPRLDAKEYNWLLASKGEYHVPN
jgi:hypothetical protein